MLRWVDSQVVNTLRQTTPVCRYRAGWGVAEKPRDHRNTADAAYCYMRRGLARPITSYGVLYGLVLHATWSCVAPGLLWRGQLWSFAVYVLRSVVLDAGYCYTRRGHAA